MCILNSESFHNPNFHCSTSEAPIPYLYSYEYSHLDIFIIRKLQIDIFHLSWETFQLTSLFFDLLCRTMSSNLCKNSILHFPRKVDQNFTEFCRIITFSRMRFKINYYANWPFYKLSRQVSRAFKTVLFALHCTICSTLCENEEFIIKLLKFLLAKLFSIVFCWYHRSLLRLYLLDKLIEKNESTVVCTAGGHEVRPSKNNSRLLFFEQ